MGDGFLPERLCLQQFKVVNPDLLPLIAASSQRFCDIVDRRVGMLTVMTYFPMDVHFPVVYGWPCGLNTYCFAFWLCACCPANWPSNVLTTTLKMLVFLPLCCFEDDLPAMIESKKNQVSPLACVAVFCIVLLWVALLWRYWLRRFLHHPQMKKWIALVFSANLSSTTVK